jgi:hypothetical protein
MRRRAAINALISAFVVLNLVAILRSNRPSWAGRPIERTVDGAMGPYALYRLRYSAWLIDRYAHLAGLNNRWEMFSHQSRFNWWYGVQAISNGGSEDLNLPNVGERTFAQRLLFDFREAKYHLNLYGNEELRHRYARRVCREIQQRGQPVESIRFVLHSQALLYPEEARRRGTHVEPEIDTRTLDEFSCLPRG